MANSVVLPKIMQVGGGALKLLPDTLDALQCKSACIISDKTMLQLGLVAQVKALLQIHCSKVGVFSDVMPEPNDRSLMAAVDLVRSEHYDCLVALGGGSAIDSAKAIALLATHKGVMRDYKAPRIVNEQSIPVIAIPTTAGTGSEATKVTVITDAQSDEKMLCIGPGLMPAAAIIDYELTLSLPFRVAADTGLDALTHAIEAYVSRKANLFSDQQAVAAIKLIAPNLQVACQQPNNLLAKEAMMLGANLAGIAFSNASVALVHGMSRPLGVHFHIPHGMSNAMLLPLVTEYSISHAEKRYAECALFMGLVNNVDDYKLAHQALLTELRHLNHILKVPSLADFGVDKQRYHALLSSMAEQAISSGSPANNPRVPSHEEMVALYTSLWTH
jgi:alcohol dehydrogenase class IV